MEEARIVEHYGAGNGDDDHYDNEARRVARFASESRLCP